MLIIFKNRINGGIFFEKDTIKYKDLHRTQKIQKSKI